MLIRQIAVSFWAFAASLATGLYAGQPTGYAALTATVISTLLTCIWTIAYLAAAWRAGVFTTEPIRLLRSIMQNRCPDCDKISLELTSENTVECVDCGSRFGVNKRNGMPRRLK